MLTDMRARPTLHQLKDVRKPHVQLESNRSPLRFACEFRMPSLKPNLLPQRDNSSSQANMATLLLWTVRNSPRAREHARHALYLLTGTREPHDKSEIK